MLTYERSNKIRGLARQLPADAIVLETDAPDMAVSVHHGERNSPEYLPYCLQSLAEVRNELPEDLARQTTENACAVLHLDEYLF
jgi:TatD DNase family protein